MRESLILRTLRCGRSKNRVNLPGIAHGVWEGRSHIECSTMSTKILGDTIDIHAGGSDLIFPHHENEIAQSEARTGKTFARYWMHGAFLNINNQKMSKSLNNFFTAREVIEKYDPEIIRLFMMSGHYRSPLNFSSELLDGAKAGLERFYNSIHNLEYLLESGKDGELNSEEEVLYNKIDAYKGRFIEVMDDDFNTADGISVIYDLVRDVNTNINVDSKKRLIEKAIAIIRELGKPLSILQKSTDSELEGEVEKLIEERQKARKEKNGHYRTR